MMRKMLLTVASVALIGASSLSGVLVQNAFAQAQSVPTLESAEVLQVQAVSACSSGDAAACRLALAAYAAVVAELVAAGVVTQEQAVAAFQEVRNEVTQAGDVAVIEDIFEELFPETATVEDGDTATASPA